MLCQTPIAFLTTTASLAVCSHQGVDPELCYAHPCRVGHQGAYKVPGSWRQWFRRWPLGHVFVEPVLLGCRVRFGERCGGR